MSSSLLVFVLLLRLLVLNADGRHELYNGKQMAEPKEYILSFPTVDNPLNVTVAQPYSKNYILVIGDWGAESVDNHRVQEAISRKMNSYYNAQLAKGYHLLMVLALGDNFYYAGQDCAHEFRDHWSYVYGANLTSVPWLANFGNHDWGGADFSAMCAWNHTRYVDPVTQIPYAANQISVEKGGCNPRNYYLPEFSYYYTIEELSLEILVMEQTSYACPNAIGGGPVHYQEVFHNCVDEHSPLSGTDIGCGYLKKISTASESMLVERAKTSPNRNFLITNHYPSRGPKLLDLFRDNRQGARGAKNAGADARAIPEISWSMFGHQHAQDCNGYSADNKEVCELILSGGGSGCCAEHALRGFFVIGFDDNASVTQPLQFNDPKISCEYPCGAFTKEDWRRYTEYAFESCCHTFDSNLNCKLFDLTQC